MFSSSLRLWLNYIFIDDGLCLEGAFVVFLQLFAALFQHPLCGGEHFAFQHLHLFAVVLFLLFRRFPGTFFVVFLQRIEHFGMLRLGRFHPFLKVCHGALQACFRFASGAFQGFLRFLLLLSHPALHVGGVFLGMFLRHLPLFLCRCQCCLQLCGLFHGLVLGRGSSFGGTFLAGLFAGLLLFATCLHVPHCKSCYSTDEEGGDGDENFCHHMVS